MEEEDDGHKGVSEKSVFILIVGLKANALVRSLQVLRPGDAVGPPPTPEVAGNSLSHLHPLADPAGQQRRLDFSWGPCCPDRRGRSRHQGDEAPAARTVAMAKAAHISPSPRCTCAHPHQLIFGERNQKRL